MEIISGKYVVECTATGDYYAYLLDHEQCCAYGETVEDAIEKVESMEEDFFREVSSMYEPEEMA